MSEDLGPLAFAPVPNPDNLGLSWSEATAARIDAETQRIVRHAWTEATTALVANRAVLTALADELTTTETLEGERLAAFLGQVAFPADIGLWGELTALAS